MADVKLPTLGFCVKAHAMRAYLESLSPEQRDAVLPTHVDTAQAFLALGDAATQLWEGLAEKQATLEDVIGSREFVRWQRDRFVDGQRYFKDRFDGAVNDLSTTRAQLSASESRCERMRVLAMQLAEESGHWARRGEVDRANAPRGCVRMINAALSADAAEDSPGGSAEPANRETAVPAPEGAGDYSSAQPLGDSTIDAAEKPPNPHIGSTLDTEHMANTGEIREPMTPIADIDRQAADAIERARVDRCKAITGREPSSKPGPDMNDPITNLVMAQRARVAPMTPIATTIGKVADSLPTSEEDERIVDAAMARREAKVKPMTPIATAGGDGKVAGPSSAMQIIIDDRDYWKRRTLEYQDTLRTTESRLASQQAEMERLDTSEKEYICRYSAACESLSVWRERAETSETELDTERERGDRLSEALDETVTRAEKAEAELGRARELLDVLRASRASNPDGFDAFYPGVARLLLRYISGDPDR